MVSPGFPNPVLDAQAAFRAIMDATSRPGCIVPIKGATQTPMPLLPSSAAIVLSLLDHDTPVWLDDPTANAVSWIRFHTGAPILDRPDDARFAVVTRPQSMPALASFDPGTPDYPDRGATVIVQVESLSCGAPMLLEGPGIHERAMIAPAPVPGDLPDQLASNGSLFPRGIDLLLVTCDEIAALPRSVRLVERG